MARTADSSETTATRTEDHGPLNDLHLRFVACGPNGGGVNVKVTADRDQFMDGELDVERVRAKILGRGVEIVGSWEPTGTFSVEGAAREAIELVRTRTAYTPEPWRVAALERDGVVWTDSVSQRDPHVHRITGGADHDSIVDVGPLYCVGCDSPPVRRGEADCAECGVW